MIARKVPKRNGLKSSIKNLVDYISSEQNSKVRIAETWTVSCLADDPATAVRDMLSIQEQNTRAKDDKTYHLLVSFPAGEKPPLGVMREIEAELSKALGYEEHQRIAAIHDDTDNYHMHVAINKIHPAKYTIHTPKNDFHTLANACATLEQKYNLKIDNHIATKTVGQGRANDMERIADMESLQGWIRRNLIEEIDRTGNWKEVHSLLEEHGVTIKKQGAGLVFAVTHGEQAGLTVKASSISRDYSMKRLEQKLGDFLPSGNFQEAHTPKKKYFKAPPLGDTYEHLWGEYNKYNANRKEAFKQIKYLNKAMRSEVTKVYDNAKRLKKLIKGGPIERKMQYKSIQVNVDRQIKDIKQKAKGRKEQLLKETKHTNWLSWAQERAKTDPQTLKYLQSRGMVDVPNIFTGNEIQLINAEKITKKGTLIVDKDVRVTKETVALTSLDEDQIAKALNTAMQRYGKELKLVGSDIFKRKIIETAAKLNINCIFKDKTLAKYHDVKIQENKLILRNVLRFIEKRNTMRLKVDDVLEHKAYYTGLSGPFSYAGLRAEGEETLLLLKFNNKVYVKKATQKEAQQAKRLKIGDAVQLSNTGLKTMKGFSR